MKPGAGQGSPLRVAPCPVQSDTGQNYYIVWGGSPTSRWPFHRLCFQDARAGQRTLGAHAIPREPAGRGTSSTRGWRGSGTIGLRRQDDMEVALAVRRRWWWRRQGRGRVRVATYRGRLPVIMQRQVLQSCVDPLGWCPQFQFIDRVGGVRDGVLLVLSSVVHRDRYPQCFLFFLVVVVAVH